jgi:hypothetical protein
MKKITFSLIMFFLLFISYGQKSNQPTHFGKTISPEKISPEGYVKCITDEYEEYLQSIDSKRMTKDQFEAWLAPLVEEYKNNQSLYSQSGGIIYIPVVVHVIHNGDAYGANENITDEQVISQITVMNQDFRRMIGTPGYNTNAVGADIEIEFVLAKVDPSGNPTNGINRVNLCQPSWSTAAINSTVKPQTIWDPTQYMNMWSVNFTDGSLLGYAQFPDGSGLQGLNANGGAANTDGVVAGYRFFGSSDLASGNFSAPFDKGRTMTHEVGHYLGLRHIWGDGGCTVDDFCDDTPRAAGPNYGCPFGTNSCTGGAYPGNDMIENYMDYTDDECMNIFTQNQKDRIVVIMNNAARRASLKTSTRDLPIPLFANDASIQIENYCSTAGSPCAGNAHKVILYNRGTSNLTSASINYNVNGGANLTHNWTGNLEPNRYAIITLSTVETTGTLNVSIINANGVADQRASNNTASKSFTFAPTTPPTDYPFTTFTFSLVGDRYGNETTWSLTNESGTVLYSGGPYGTLGSNTTQNLVNNQVWNLPAGGCYTFTINDSFGDGICCAYGSGSWTIRTNSGATTVATGGTFTTSQSASFTNASLSSANFDALNSISLYPNPTNDVLNIITPSELGIPTNATIFNNLGQTVKRVNVSANEFSVDASSLSGGVYFIKLDFENNSKTLRFVKK